MDSKGGVGEGDLLQRGKRRKKEWEASDLVLLSSYSLSVTRCRKDSCDTDLNFKRATGSKRSLAENRKALKPARPVSEE